MTFRFAPAVRDRVSLLIAFGGASGSGKTLSALKTARGLAGGDDTKIAMIDTEAGRGKHYAVAPGERPGPDRFAFQHADLRPPFTPEAYLEAIKAADAAEFAVILVDSFSHEWEGEGGLQDMHTANLDAAVERARQSHENGNRNYAFDEAKTAERLSIGAWKDPKMRHKRLVSGLLQCRAHLIICLRADEKMRIEQVEEKGRNGQTYKKTNIIQPKDLPPEERWVPICEKRFMYEMTLSLVLTPQNPGIPVPVKLQAQHRPALPLDRHVSEQAGEMLALWSAGQTIKAAATSGNGHAAPKVRGDDFGDEETESERLMRHEKALAAAAPHGWTALKEAWEGLSSEDQDALRNQLNERFKPIARAAGQQAQATA